MKGLLCSIDPGRDKTGVALVHADGTLERNASSAPWTMSRSWHAFSPGKRSSR